MNNTERRNRFLRDYSEVGWDYYSSKPITETIGEQALAVPPEEITYEKVKFYGSDVVEHTCPAIKDFNNQGSHQYMYIHGNMNGVWVVEQKIFTYSSTIIRVSYCPFCGHNLESECKKAMEVLK